jgi:DeoR/GlpR family transcriptional regulator of sugar metabolism
VALSGRQIEIIEFIYAHGSVMMSDVVSLNHISRQAAIKELALMVENGLIVRRGLGRRVHYVMR